MREPIFRRTGRAHLWKVFGCCLALLLTTLMGMSYRQTERQTELEMRNLGLVLEARLDSGLLQPLQAGLREVEARMAGDGLGRATLDQAAVARFRDAVARVAGGRDFDLIDAQGRLVDRVGVDGRGPVFEALHNWSLLDGQPAERGRLVTGQDPARHVLRFALPLMDEQGQVYGWVGNSLDLHVVTELFRQMNVGPSGVISIRRTDRPEPVLRDPPVADDRLPQERAALDAQRLDVAREGSFHMRSPLDGVERLYRFKRIGDYPLALTIGLASEDYRREWYYTVVWTSALSAVLFVLIVYIDRRSQRYQRREAQAVEELAFMAYHDALTGLANARQVKDRVAQAILQAEEEGGGFCLLYLDLDHFKTINDSLGHPVGDRILQEMAVRLTRLPDVDTVARLGGDEYLMLAPLPSSEVVGSVLLNLGMRLREPWNLCDCQWDVRASVGIACYPEHGKDFSELFKAADIALNHAKKRGRDRHVLYLPAMGEVARDSLQVQVELRAALRNHEFELHYQPQIDLASGAIAGAEALLRWRHPERGLIYPDAFIREAESSGLIVPIGRWLLREACQQAAAWIRQGLGPRIVAVNCSVIEFRQADFVQSVAQAMAAAGLEASLLELELTESILIEDTELMIGKFRQLKAMGVRLAIDDFGTGYSSMAYLKHLTVDRLKIDRSFVRNLAQSPDDRMIVEAMVTLAHNLKLQIVAEGVETDEVLPILADMGCDEAQGYYFSRPVPVREFETYVRASEAVVQG